MHETLEASWGSSEGRVSIWHRPKPGKGNPINGQEWFTYPDEFDEVVKYIGTLEGRDVYFSPPVYDADSRTPEHAKWVSTIWCDADLCHPSNFRLPPSRVLQTSAGNGDRYQCFWDLDQPVTAREASLIAWKIAYAHRDQGADQSSWAANKLMRIPGTSNTNWGEWIVQETESTGEIYSDMDLLGAYEDIDEALWPGGEKSARAVLAPMPTGPIIQPDDLPDFQDLMMMIPATEVRLMDLIYKEPKTGPEGWRSEQRYALLTALLRYGFTIPQTLSIAWNSPASANVREDPRGISFLQSEAEKAKREIDDEQGANTRAASEVKKISKLPKIELLSKEERKRYEARRTWDTEYFAWAKTKVEPFNAPYHESMMWTILAVAFGETGHIQKRNVKIPLSLYTMTLGPSSTGKSESEGLGMSVIRRMFPGNSPDLGGDFSKNAMMEQLLERNGKVSLMRNDEADGMFEEMAKPGGWQSGIMEAWTNIHGGNIPQQSRIGKNELRIDNAWGIVVMHMMGTTTGMLGILDRRMFLKGYLARQVWFIGEDIEVPDEMLRPRQAEDDDERSFDGVPKHWAQFFATMRAKILAGVTTTSRAMKLTEEAADRLGDMAISIRKRYKHSPDPELYTPAITRFTDHVWKAAILIAMSQGKIYADMGDLMVALGHAEAWLRDLETVASGISDTHFSKQLDDIEKFIAGKADQEVLLQALYAHRKEPKRMTDEYIANLVSQGRVGQRIAVNQPTYVFIRKEEKK